MKWIFFSSFSRYFPVLRNNLHFLAFSSVSLSLPNFSLSVSILTKIICWLPIARARANALLSSSSSAKPFFKKMHLNSSGAEKTKTWCRKISFTKKKKEKNSKRNERCNLFQHLFSFRYSGWCEKKRSERNSAQLLRRTFKRLLSPFHRKLIKILPFLSLHNRNNQKFVTKSKEFLKC